MIFYDFTRIYSVGAGAVDDAVWGRLRRPLLGRRDETQRATQASPHRIRPTAAPTDVYPDTFVKVHYRVLSQRGTIW